MAPEVGKSGVTHIRAAVADVVEEQFYYLLDHLADNDPHESSDCRMCERCERLRAVLLEIFN
jgi:hypothetical protein